MYVKDMSQVNCFVVVSKQPELLHYLGKNFVKNSKPFGQLTHCYVL